MTSRLLPLLSSILLAAAGVSGCATGAPPGFSKGDAWVFPLVGPLEGSVLITPVTIGEKGPYLFVLDPDAPMTSIDEELATDLGLYLKDGPRMIDESDTTHPTRLAEVPVMSLGSLTVKARVVMLHGRGAYATDGRDVRGVIGRDIIADSLVFGFDRDAGMAYLATRDTFTPPASSVRLPYTEQPMRRNIGDNVTVNRRIARATINGAAAKLHLDLGAVSSQLASTKWKGARLAPVPYKASTIDEIGMVRGVDKAGIANRVEAGPASAMGLTMIPYGDKRFDEDYIDGTLGLNFFAPYVVWADWYDKAYYLTARDGEGDGVQQRLARWDAPALAACREPACASARLEAITTPVASDPATPPSPTPPAMPAEAEPAPAVPPTLVVARDREVASLGYELLLEAVGADGRPLGLPRLTATFPPDTLEIRQKLSPVFAGARFRVLDVSPFVRACPSSGTGCVFELVPPR